MPQSLELARFILNPEVEQEYMARHPAFVEAAKKHFPGLISITLIRLESNNWMDVLLWESKEAAEQAFKVAFEIPDIAACLSIISKHLPLEYGEVIEHHTREQAQS